MLMIQMFIFEEEIRLRSTEFLQNFNCESVNQIINDVELKANLCRVSQTKEFQMKRFLI